MPDRKQTRRQFVTKAPNGNGTVSVRVVAMNLDHVTWWDAYVQKEIDTNFRYKSRADIGWHWPRIFYFTNATKFLLQRPTGYTLGIVLPGNKFMPCALVSLVHYKFFPNRRQKATFLWYLADAPREILDRQLIRFGLTYSPPKMLGRIGLDIMTTHSFINGQQGRSELHASPSGGERLMEWYRKQGMINFSSQGKLPGIRRFLGNDGRYFYFTSSDAIIFSQRLDEFR